MIIGTLTNKHLLINLKDVYLFEAFTRKFGHKYFPVEKSRNSDYIWMDEEP